MTNVKPTIANLSPYLSTYAFNSQLGTSDSHHGMTCSQHRGAEIGCLGSLEPLIPKVWDMRMEMKRKGILHESSLIPTANSGVLTGNINPYYPRSLHCQNKALLWPKWGLLWLTWSLYWSTWSPMVNWEFQIANLRPKIVILSTPNARCLCSIRALKRTSNNV